MKRRLWIHWAATAALLLASSCTGLTGTAELQPVVAPPSTAPPPAAPAPAPTTSVATPTTIAPRVHFELTIVPDPGTIELEGPDGRPVTVMTPFSGELAVPVEVRAALDGYNQLTEQLTGTTDATVTLFLDPAGQLVHQLAEWSTGGAPKQVAFTPDGSQIWVTLLDGTGLEVYDAATGGLIEAVDLPDAGSVEVIFNRAGSLAYVSQMETASVFEIDVATRRVLRRLPAGGVWTKVMVLSPDEQTLYVSNWVSNNVGEIDLTTGEVRRRIHALSFRIALTRDREDPRHVRSAAPQPRQHGRAPDARCHRPLPGA